jgi:hypothetical protein
VRLIELWWKWRAGKVGRRNSARPGLTSVACRCGAAPDSPIWQLADLRSSSPSVHQGRVLNKLRMGSREMYKTSKPLHHGE